MKRHSPRLAKRPPKSARMDPSARLTRGEPLSNKSEDEHVFITQTSPVDRDDLLKLEQDALNAFTRKDEKSFTNILMKSSLLFVRDKGVMLATFAGWTQAVKQLLITNPSSSEYMEGTIRTDLLLNYYFTHLVPEKIPGSCDPRWLVQKALLQSIKHKLYDIFTMLLPVVGVDFVDNSCHYPFDYAFRYCTGVNELKQFLRPLFAKIGPRTPFGVFAQNLIDLSYTGDTELIPILFKKFSQKVKNNLTGPQVALKQSIRKGRDEMVRCLIEQLEKFVPYYNNQINLHIAVEAQKLSILQYLIHHHHNSYALREYGAENAKALENFLKKAKSPELYHQVISSV